MRSAEPEAWPPPVRAGVAPHREAEAPAPDAFATAEAAADAVLFEGYLLYPYRRSSGQDRTRWRFGVVAPRAWIEARGVQPPTISGAVDAWRQQTECLFEGPLTGCLRLKLRFLQLNHRSVQAVDPVDGFVEVEALRIGADRHHTTDVGVPREFVRELDVADLTQRPYHAGFALPAKETVEPLGDGRGRVVRRAWPLSATVRLTLTEVAAPKPLHKLCLVVENTLSGVSTDLPRHEVLRHSLIAAHCLLGLDTGAFLSATSPPPWATAAAKRCVNLSTFPVLGGPPGSRSVVLSAPIILYDHPPIARDHSGDLPAATDLDAAETMPPEDLSRSHGAIRSVRPRPRTDPDADTAPLPTPAPDPASEADPVSEPDAVFEAEGREPRGAGTPQPAVPWWNPRADAAVRCEPHEVVVDGVPVRRGSRVRLRPAPDGPEAHEAFLDGRTARVEAVFPDVDGAWHVAVIVEEDPGADLHRWYGRFHYYTPEEIEPVCDTEP